MTPPAATAAGRAKAPKPARKAPPKGRSSAPTWRSSPPKGRVSASRAAARPTASHRGRTVRSSAAPRIARRVSGPSGGRAAAAAAAALPRPHLAPLGPRLVAFASTLPDRSIVDRMVRGRVWIGVLGTLLIGLVFAQVTLLKLNAGIGRAVEKGAALERVNGELRAQVSQLESGERIQEQAAALGMVMPPAGQISYVRPQGGGDVGAAVAALAEGRFNDPALASPLPGIGGPPDSLATALSDPQGAAGDGSADGSTDGSTGVANANAGDQSSSSSDQGSGDQSSSDQGSGDQSSSDQGSGGGAPTTAAQDGQTASVTGGTDGGGQGQ